MLALLAALAFADPEPRDLTAHQAWARVYRRGQVTAAVGIALPAVSPVALFLAQRRVVDCNRLTCSQGPDAPYDVAIGAPLVAAVPLVALGTMWQCRALANLDGRRRVCPGPIGAVVALPVAAVGLTYVVMTGQTAGLFPLAAWPIAWGMGIGQLIANERRWGHVADIAVVPTFERGNAGMAVGARW